MDEFSAERATYKIFCVYWKLKAHTGNILACQTNEIPTIANQFVVRTSKWEQEWEKKVFFLSHVWSWRLVFRELCIISLANDSWFLLQFMHIDCPLMTMISNMNKVAKIIIIQHLPAPSTIRRLYNKSYWQLAIRLNFGKWNWQWIEIKVFCSMLNNNVSQLKCALIVWIFQKHHTMQMRTIQNHSILKFKNLNGTI